MPRRLFLFVGSLLTVFGLGLLVLALWPRPERPLRPIPVATGEWVPFIGAKLSNHGPVGEAVSAILRRAGYQPAYQFTSWDRAQDMVAEGSAMAAVPFVETAPRRQRFVLSDGFLSFDSVLFFDPARVDMVRLREWAKQPTDGVFELGIIRGYELWAPLFETVTASGEPFEDTREAFEGLGSGKVHLIPESRAVGLHLLRDPTFPMDSQALDYLRPPPGEGVVAQSSELLRFILPSTSNGIRLRSELDAAIHELREEGLFDEIQRRLDSSIPAASHPDRVVVVHPVEAQSDGGETFRLPAGTLARVVAWPDGYAAPLSADVQTELETFRVKLINGPLRGRIVHLPIASTKLASGGETQ